MRRHLYLVINHGSASNYLNNVDADMENYLRFFTSPNGGLWRFNQHKMLPEITIYNDNFEFSKFKKEIETDNKADHPLDYVVFVFCGHGYLNEKSQRCMEVSPKEDITELQLFQVLSGKRVLLISDTCQKTYIPSQIIKENQQNFSNIDQRSYQQYCKTIYNEAVMQMPAGTITAGYAVSKEECASDDENGGLYSQALLMTANELATNNQIKDELISFSFIHSIARKVVIETTSGTKYPQHPTCTQIRHPRQLPFVVKPNIESIN